MPRESQQRRDLRLLYVFHGDSREAGVTPYIYLHAESSREGLDGAGLEDTPYIYLHAESSREGLDGAGFEDTPYTYLPEFEDGAGFDNAPYIYLPEFRARWSRV